MFTLFFAGDRLAPGFEVDGIPIQEYLQGAFIKAMQHWSTSAGESFHAVSPAALTLRGYAEAVAAYFGQEANLRFVGWDEFRAIVGEDDAHATYDHIAHSPNASIDKAKLTTVTSGNAS